MRTARGRAGAPWVAGLVAIACGCGGGAASGGARAGAPVTIGEEPIRCDVPHAPATDRYEAAVRLARAGDPGAVPALISACDAGNPCACTEAGEAYADGEAVPRDVERGLALLDRGCTHGDGWGCHAEGFVLWRYHPERVDHAAELFENGCEEGSAAACGELGRFRISGIGGGTAASDAVPLYDRACQGGESFFCYLQGQAFAYGIGAARDPERARELLTWSCEEAGVAAACTQWSQLLPEDDPSRAQYLQRGCDAGDPFACDLADASAASRTGTADQQLVFDVATAQSLAPGGELSVDGPIGGSVEVGALGLRPSCLGFVSSAADAVIDVAPGIPTMTIRAHADADTVLAVRDPSGRWTCADDLPAGVYQAAITVTSPSAGPWAIWGGLLRPAEIPGAIEITTD